MVGALREGDRTEEFWTLDEIPGPRMPDVPVFVLTSRKTFSGAEEFSYNLKTRKRAILIGETTGGGANPGGSFPINDSFRMFIPTGRAINPVTGVNFFDAGAFAHWLGRSLPSEGQWEKAARGTADERIYPWGMRFNVRHLNSRGAKKRDTTPVDHYPDGASPFGVLDMSGNVWEWTETWFDENQDLMLLKGGCHALTKQYATISHRHFNDPGFANNLTGFRTIELL